VDRGYFQLIEGTGAGSAKGPSPTNADQRSGSRYADAKITVPCAPATRDARAHAVERPHVIVEQ